jgi:hypothetical protein
MITQNGRAERRCCGGLNLALYFSHVRSSDLFSTCFLQNAPIRRAFNRKPIMHGIPITRDALNGPYLNIRLGISYLSLSACWGNDSFSLSLLITPARSNSV